MGITRKYTSQIKERFLLIKIGIVTHKSNFHFLLRILNDKEMCHENSMDITIHQIEHCEKTNLILHLFVVRSCFTLAYFPMREKGTYPPNNKNYSVDYPLRENMLEQIF